MATNPRSLRYFSAGRLTPFIYEATAKTRPESPSIKPHSAVPDPLAVSSGTMPAPRSSTTNPIVVDNNTNPDPKPDLTPIEIMRIHCKKTLNEERLRF